MYDIKRSMKRPAVEHACQLRIRASRGADHRGRHRRTRPGSQGRRAGKKTISIQKLDEAARRDHGGRRHDPSARFTVFLPYPQPHHPRNTSTSYGEAVDMVGGPQIRNAGHHRRQHLQRRHLGGLRLHAPCLGRPSSSLTGIHGKRYLPIKDFYIKAGTVDINVAEGRKFRQPSSSRKNRMRKHLRLLPEIRYAQRGNCDDRLLRQRPPAPTKRRSDRITSASGVAGPVPMRARPLDRGVPDRQSPVTMENIEACAKTVLEQPA